jgi:hypothetical protein
MTINQGDLARVVSHEPSQDWPSIIEIVAYWGKGEGRRGRRRSLMIEADAFFGRGRYGAPLSGDQLLAMIDRLRKQGPDYDEHKHRLQSAGARRAQRTTPQPRDRRSS